MCKIPKVIHYIWIGGNEKSEDIKRCIASWKKYMPEYEIIEWNESNFDINSCKYLKQAYDEKMWAFASDYMRFKVLHNCGGIYLDTDVELLKKIPENVLRNSSFTGVEFSKKVSPGLIFACNKNDKIAQYMMNKYENINFDKGNIITVNSIISNYLCERGFVENNKFQIVDGLAIYPHEYFCGYDQDVKEVCITDKTISVHHYYGTWYKKGVKHNFQKIIKKIIGINNYRILLKVKKKVIESLKLKNED